MDFHTPRNVTFDEHHDAVDRMIKIVGAPAMSDKEKHDYLDKVDPERKLIKFAIERIEADLVTKKEDAWKVGALLRSFDRYKVWEKEDGKLILQRNDCSRLHKMIAACEKGMFYDGEDKQFKWSHADSFRTIDDAKVFVVRHDWAAAFESSAADVFDPASPFRLPFPKNIFEFRLNGNTVMLHMAPTADGCGINSTMMLEGVEGVWFSLPVESMSAIFAYCERQVRAISIALEAQVAEHEVVRAPAKLNAKRAKDGKPALRDFHVVDLARRIKNASRAAPRPDPQPTGRHVRMHFRRGHWRHLQTHTTWIEWMLVGDPDLGFIDKHYRI
jgi:hypothetical protein